MTTTFKKEDFNADFNHAAPIVEMMNNMGFTNVKVQTSLANGLSHYVSLCVEVLNEGRCYAEMNIMNNIADITIRISNHDSGLERNCGGVCGNKMTMGAFKRLIETGAIKNNN